MFAIDSSANTLGRLTELWARIRRSVALGSTWLATMALISLLRELRILSPAHPALTCRPICIPSISQRDWRSLVGLVGQPGDNTLLRGLTVVPEPGTATLIIGGLGLLAVQFRRRR